MTAPAHLLTRPLAHQREFDLHIPIAVTLVPVKYLMVALDRDEDAILNLIELGSLAWAFNIAMPGTERREVRVWRESALAYAKCGVRSAECGVETDDLDKVVCAIVGRAQALRARMLADQWKSSSTHINRLVAAGVLKAASTIRPKVSPLIDAASCRQFLQARRILG